LDLPEKNRNSRLLEVSSKLIRAW